MAREPLKAKPARRASSSKHGDTLRILILLALVGVLMSVVSAYYYLGVVVSMYMRDPVGEDAWGPVGAMSGLALAVSVVVVLGLGIYPGPVLAWARLAAQSLL